MIVVTRGDAVNELHLVVEYPALNPDRQRPGYVDDRVCRTRCGRLVALVAGRIPGPQAMCDPCRP